MNRFDRLAPFLFLFPRLARTMRNPTIDDVAKRAGYSKATVSAVLNDSAKVKDSTRRKILAVMEDLNYRPRASARNGFRPGLARSLGLIIKEVDNPYYGQIVAGARSYANERGYTVLTGSSEGDYESEQRIVNVLKSKDVDGLIIVPLLDEKADLSYLFDLKRRNFPFVLLEAIRGVPASVIDIDNVAASKRATEFLIENGHERIVHFAGPSYSTHSGERIEGMRRAYSETSLVFTDESVIAAGAYAADGYKTALTYLREAGDSRPTAITCYNDLVAIGVLRACSELGLDVPGDISVIGNDDIDLLEFLPLKLTTIRVPRFEMGRKAAELIIKHIESQEKLPPERIDLEAELVVRDSTRAVTAKAL